MEKLCLKSKYKESSNERVFILDASGADDTMNVFPMWALSKPCLIHGSETLPSPLFATETGANISEMNGRELWPVVKWMGESAFI